MDREPTRFDVYKDILYKLEQCGGAWNGMYYNVSFSYIEKETLLKDVRCFTEILRRLYG